MGFNYGLERKRFEADRRADHKKYLTAGMDETQIQAMYDFDRGLFNEERRYRTHTQPLDGAVFGDMGGNGDDAGEDQSPLLQKYLCQMSVSQPEISGWGRYDWIEDINTPELAAYLKSLPEADLELLTCMVADGLSRAEISRKIGVSRACITKRANRIKKVLEKSYPSRLTK